MIAKLLRSRGARKFRKNRMAMASLGVIVLYFFIAAVVGLAGFITLEETLERVGPRNLPGLGGEQTGEKRYEDLGEIYLTFLEGAVRGQASSTSLGSLSVKEQLSKEELQATIDEADALYERLGEFDSLNNDPEAKKLLDELEAKIFSVTETPGVLGGFSRWLEVSLGTDRQGRSIMLRAIYSIKVAILVGLVTSLISVILGSLLGAAAAFYGGWVDHLVIWLYSTFSSIPSLVLLTVLVFMFTGSIFDGTLIPIYVAFCMTFWIGPCRVIRGETLKIKELEYVQAATAIGFSRFYILVRHVIPNTSHLMFINFALLFIGAIKSEVILSFLGLGVKKGPSWGIMISQSGQEVINGFFWQIGAATAFMFFLVLAFNILTDALQDAFDPKHVS